MNLAIIGSRDFSDYPLLKREVLNFVADEKLNVTTVVSGGARGADKLGEKLADEKRWGKMIFLPEWDVYGKSAGFRRNEDIVQNADALIAFRINMSRGTTHSIGLARKKGIKVKVVDIKNNFL